MRFANVSAFTITFRLLWVMFNASPEKQFSNENDGTKIWKLFFWWKNSFEKLFSHEILNINPFAQNRYHCKSHVKTYPLSHSFSLSLSLYIYIYSGRNKYKTPHWIIIDLISIFSKKILINKTSFSREIIIRQFLKKCISGLVGFYV